MAIATVAVTGALAPAAHAADPLTIDPAIDRGVAQLEGVQLPDGSFGARLAVRDSASAAEALRSARPDSAAGARVVNTFQIDHRKGTLALTGP